MRVIYVANRASHTISVINGFSDKVAAGVRFKVNPVNSGTIICDNQSGTNQNEYPTNVYIYIDNATKCTGQLPYAKSPAAL
jgi:YVTN family beta-propeller protein